MNMTGSLSIETKQLGKGVQGLCQGAMCKVCKRNIARGDVGCTELLKEILKSKAQRVETKRSMYY